MNFCGFSCAFLPLSTSYPGTPSPAAETLEHESREEGFWVHHCPPCDYAQVEPQHVRGKLLTPSYSHGSPAPCFPAQQSPSHQRLRVLALGRWLLAGPSRADAPKICSAGGGGVPGEVEHSLNFLAALNSHWRGQCRSGGSPFLISLCPFSPIAYF